MSRDFRGGGSQRGGRRDRRARRCRRNRPVDPECTYFEFGEEPSAGCMRQLGGKGVPKEAISSVKMLG